MAWTERQKDAIEKRNSNLLVSAAAGSGKTSVLVERIKSLLLDENTAVDRMLIVTFTNAASSEMKERIFSMLGSASKDPEICPERRSFLRHQMNLLPNAYICTFDKFAIQLVHRYYHIIGVKPDLSICEGPQQSILKNEAMQELFDSLYESSDPDFIAFLDRYASAYGDGDVKALVLGFHTFLQSLPDPWNYINRIKSGDHFIPSEYIDFTVQYSRKEIQAAKGLFEIILSTLSSSSVIKGCDAIRKDIESLVFIEKLFENNNVEEAFAAIKDMTFARMSVPKVEKESWNAIKEEVDFVRKKGKDRIGRLKELITDADEASLLLEKEKIQQPLNQLCLLTGEFDRIYREKKEKKGLADFSDMQHFALKILENQDVCSELKSSLDYIFVDEYQDSNLIQETLINRICRDDNVFMVGDVKQSIYKFRLAEPELFINKYDCYKNGEEKSQVIDLNSNFRSKIPVIEYINKVFALLMKKDSCGIEYDDDARLLEGNPYDGPGLYEPRLFLINRDAEDGDLEEEISELKSDELEALNAVRLIKEYVGKPIYDSKKGCMRQLRFSDMVILLRAAKGHGEVFYDILSRADIPVYMDRGEGYFDTLEIQVFLNLLRIIDNRKRDLPLLSVLRFPSFGFNSGDLADIRINSKSKGKISFSDAFYLYASEGPDENLRSRCLAFIAKLEVWRTESSNMPLADFLWKLLNETGVSYFAAAVTGGSQREANLRALVNKAESYESDSSTGLYGFINYIEMINARGGKVETGQVKILSESADVVRIMTIHKSKGLEFPFVLIAGLGSDIRPVKSKGKAAWDKRFGASIRVVNPKTSMYCDPLSLRLINLRKEDEELAECIRVLYVAMTRAKDILLMSAAAKNAHELIKSSERLVNGDIRGFRSYFEMIFSAVGRGKTDILGAKDLISARFDDAVIIDDIKMGLRGGFDISGYSAFSEIEKRLTYDYAPLPSKQAKRKYSVSEIAEGAHEFSGRIAVTDETEESVSEELMLKGAAKGTAYHTVMEHIPFSSEGKSYNEIAAFIGELREKHILSDEEANSVDPFRIKAFFDSDLGKRAVDSDELFRESPFVFKTEYHGHEVLVQGVIDCYFRKGDKYYLLDYKSNRIDRNRIDEELQRMKDTYLPQLSLYKDALEKILEIKVEEASLWLFSIDTELKL